METNKILRLRQVGDILDKVTIDFLGNKTFQFRFALDVENPTSGRIFIQMTYTAPCTKTGIPTEFHGRKFYLSKYMTEDEIIKTAYLAFKLAVEHEIMEAFRVNGKVLFNPHVSYEALLRISEEEVKRS